MAGRSKTPVYQYDAEGKYLQTFETRNAVFQKYYDGKKGDLFPNGVYKPLPDGTYVTKERIGRDGLLKAIAIENDPLCDEKKDVPIAFYNRTGKKIAVFSSLHVAAQLTGKDYNLLRRNITRSQKYIRNDVLIKEELDLKL